MFGEYITQIAFISQSSHSRRWAGTPQEPYFSGSRGCEGNVVGLKYHSQDNMARKQQSRDSNPRLVLRLLCSFCCALFPWQRYETAQTAVSRKERKPGWQMWVPAPPTLPSPQCLVVTVNHPAAPSRLEHPFETPTLQHLLKVDYKARFCVHLPTGLGAPDSGGCCSQILVSVLPHSPPQNPHPASNFRVDGIGPSQ